MPSRTGIACGIRVAWWMRSNTNLDMIARQNNNVLRLFTGWCALLLYVTAFSPIGMGVAAVLATIDSDHHALFQPNSDGMRLVLHHDVKCSGHQHHAVSRALILLAQPAGGSDPDHVLQFSSANSPARESQLLIPAANESEFIVIPYSEPATFIADFPIQFIPPPRPPPDTFGNLLNVRFTVLLI